MKKLDVQPLPTIDNAGGIDRREFLKASAVGLLVAVTASFSAKRAQAASMSNMPSDGGQNLGAYIQVQADSTNSKNVITLYFGTSEMGQGILTGLAQLVAEELQVDWTQIKTAFTPAGLFVDGKSAYGNPLFGYFQGTGGSTSMMAWYSAIRDAGAIARQKLVAAGIDYFIAQGLTNASTTNCVASGGYVYYQKDNIGVERKVLYATIASAANLKNVPNAAWANSSAVIGTRAKRIDIPEKVYGTAVFGIDVMLPGMTFATVVHSPTVGGTVASMPAAPAGSRLVPIPGADGKTVAVGVVAATTWDAMRIANSLAITWTASTSVDSAAILASAQSLMTSGSPSGVKGEYETLGDANAAFNSAPSKIDATYQLPYLAHAPMEVMNCTVAINAAQTECEIWAPTQGQDGCIYTAKGILGPDTNVIVHTPYLGGGFGRKFETDYVREAIIVAKAIGQPVKLTWSRTQDLRNDKYRPFNLIRVQAGMTGTGASTAITSLIYRNVSQPVNPGVEDSGALNGATGLSYDIANRNIDYVRLPSGAPVGYWRSVGESCNVFAVESAIDEIAAKQGITPFDLRKKLLAKNSSGLQVLTTAVNMSSAVTIPSGSACGMAYMEGFGSIVALVVEISLDSTGKIKVNKAWCAVAIGKVINPDIVEAQLQGGIAHGISAALWGGVTFTNGTPNVSNFSNYRVMRLPEMPVVTIATVNVPLPSGWEVGGVGEIGVPCVAPAIANAYAKLKGIRVRTLPFYPGSTMGGL